MEPIFQRFGDVTIQRLEKNKGTSESASAAESDDEGTSLKRTGFADSHVSLKKFKGEASSSKDDQQDDDTAKISESEVNFSDEELSDFGSEEDDEEEIEEKMRSDEDEKSLEGPGKMESDVSQDNAKKDGNQPEGDDYDFDIKKKLKEMGEISFQTVKKGEVKPKKDIVQENEVVVTPARKTGTSDEETGERKGLNLRRNIREVMDETKLDESTLAAQRLEMERLQRVQEQQRLLREFQRQAAQEKMQNKVISLLQGNNFSSKPYPSGNNTTRIGNTVLVKLPNGQTKSMTRLPKRPFDVVRVQKSINSSGQPPFPSSSGMKGLITVKKPSAMGVPSPSTVTTNLTPSVSIAPVAKKPLSLLSSSSSSKFYSESDSDEDVKPVSPDIKPCLSAASKEPVATIDISSDEDCIVVSEPEPEDESEDDPSNSGMHTNDGFNQPDEQGRVVVNIGHPDNESDLFLAPQIARIIKPHQIGGVRFLYDNVIESITRFESSAGFGCILAHSMGLGKTLQVVCFSDIFLRHTPAKTILCIMPINTLQNWMAEYNMWLPTPEGLPNSPLVAHGEVRPRNFNLYVLNDSHKTLTARHKVIRSWKQDGGVLLIGYEQFRLLTLRKHPKSRKKPNVIEPFEDDKNKEMFDEIHIALVKPGPDLVICDEGHRIKNSHASISQALKQMRTKRRVVLTGYPLQNNLMEYWCMVDFVRPNYLGTKTEFCNMFERPIMNGQCIDSTQADIKLMRYRAHVLHSLLVGFVQRRSHAVLQTALPQKEEYVLLVRMLPFQRKLYETFMDEFVRSQAVPNPLKAFAVCCKIWNHPDVLYNFLKKRARGDAVDIDLEEVSSGDSSKEKPKKASARARKTVKGKKEGKPAASVTPYNTNSTLPTESIPTPLGPQSTATNSFDNFYPGSNNANSYPPNNFNNSNNQQFGYNHNYPNFQQQSYWDQKDYYQQYNMNYNNSGGLCSSSEIVDPKSENSNEPKPKINIISDIKLPSFGSPDKKIKILSDIKLETKNEEDVDDKSDIKPEMKKLIKEELGEENTIGESSLKQITKENKEDTGIPYDWAIELLKDYIPGRIENSAKMEILFCIIGESIALGDRLLVFSQSLITLDLIEQFLQMNYVPGEAQKWCKNTSYYRLDGSTSALEREKLINEFNSNPKIHLFLVSTRAGSLGINLIGANRVVVLDASWNPCHDTQAVCRVYRYGQRKPCFVYRLVVDNCLEKKIYDRQINKQGMSDRVVDECNPDAHLTLKDVSTLCWDDKKDEGEEKCWTHLKDNYIDVVLQKVIENHGRRLNKEPFQHESLLVDRKEKQLSVMEKRLAKKGYEREKQAARQPAYGLLAGGRGGHRPVASVRPMLQGNGRDSRWIPAEHWQRQGMTAQEMTLPLDVVIPTNQPEKGNIVLKAGQKVLVLKSPKGVYMQLENGKIVAIKTAIKVKGKAEDNHDPGKLLKPNPGPPRKIVKPFTPGIAKMNVRSIRQSVPNLVSRIQNFAKRDVVPRGRLPVVTPKRQTMTAMRDGSGANAEVFPSTSSSDDEHHISDSTSSSDDIQKRISMIKNQVSIKRLSQPQRPDIDKHALQRLEETASSMMTDNSPFQETLDHITGSYKDDSDHNKPPSDVSDNSDEVTYVSEQPPPCQNYPQPQQNPVTSSQPQTVPELKTEPPPNDYYNNYYNYNAQPYHAPPPQTYGYPPPPPSAAQPPPFEMMGGYVAPQAPPPQQYGAYGGYQTYAPPPPQQHYAPPPSQPNSYDYGTPYNNYHNPYPTQQYAPPPQTMYPPPIHQASVSNTGQGYQDYQQQYAQNYYPNS